MGHWQVSVMGQVYCMVLTAPDEVPVNGGAAKKRNMKAARLWEARQGARMASEASTSVLTRFWLARSQHNMGSLAPEAV